MVTYFCRPDWSPPLSWTWFKPYPHLSWDEHFQEIISYFHIARNLHRTTNCCVKLKPKSPDPEMTSVAMGCVLFPFTATSRTNLPRRKWLPGWLIIFAWEIQKLVDLPIFLSYIIAVVATYLTHPGFFPQCSNATDLPILAWIAISTCPFPKMANSLSLKKMAMNEREYRSPFLGTQLCNILDYPK